MAEIAEQFDRSGISATGTAITPPAKLPLCVEVVGNTATPKVVDRDVLVGCDDTGQEIHRVTVTFDDGTTTTTDLINGAPQVTQSPSFQAAKSEIDTETMTYFATNITTGDAEFGRIVELTRETPFVDGVAQPYVYKNVLGTDVTAIVTAAPYSLSVAQQRKLLDTTELDVTAATALTWGSAFSTYAEVYVNAQDANVIWDINGAVPTDNYSEEENGGVTIRLLDRDEMDAFQIAAADAAGNGDPSLTARISFREWNIAPDED